MRRLILALTAVVLVTTACQPGEEPDNRGAVVAEVEVPGQPPAVTHGNDPLPPKPPSLVAQLAPEFAWPCEGTGTEGRRVQMIYAHTGAGNLAANRPSLEGIARRIQGTFLTSAQRDGQQRLVRFVTDAGCSLSILDAVVSPNAVASFDQMIAEFAAAGLNRRDRIYHAWVEGNAYCGIGTVYSDDRPTGNLNEGNAQYSRSDRPCWNYAEAHEITHNLGGVQNSAPNSTGGLHSRDEYDVMSYPDGAPQGQMIQPFPCPDVVNEDRLDCGANDYFAATPAPGSYLATHWNVANSSALSRGAPPTTTPPPPTSSSSTTSSSTTSTSLGKGVTKTTMTIPTGLRVDREVTVTVKVTGDCRPQGVVAFYVSGKLLSRQILDGNGVASVRLTFSSAGRFTVRADYEGSDTCAKSRATARPRVVA